MNTSQLSTNEDTGADTAATPASIDEARWRSVVARDANADGSFYTAVVTTGIYCRPSCAARTPHRMNVRFYETADEARTNGFRPCKRCAPDEPRLSARQTSTIERICRVIESSHEALSLQQLADAAGMSRYHFHRLFRSIVGVTPRAYAVAHRSHRVRDELLQTRSSVTAAIYAAGFSAGGTFYHTSDDVIGMTPTDYRNGGAHAQIRYAVDTCSLGAILVARSNRGICAIFLGDEPLTLVSELRDRFPRAEFVDGDEEFERLVARVVGFVDTPAGTLDLPLDVRGTAFQHRVWQALREIPAGSTVSYAALAKRIGSPDSVRAVGRACATNPVAIAIPCHRVVRTDGDLAGYRWGVNRKHALIAREASAMSALHEDTAAAANGEEVASANR